MAPSRVEQYRRWFEYEKDSHRKVLESLETVPQDQREVGWVSEGTRRHRSRHRCAADVAIPVVRRPSAPQACFHQGSHWTTWPAT